MPWLKAMAIANKQHYQQQGKERTHLERCLFLWPSWHHGWWLMEIFHHVVFSKSFCKNLVVADLLAFSELPFNNSVVCGYSCTFDLFRKLIYVYTYHKFTNCFRFVQRSSKNDKICTSYGDGGCDGLFHDGIRWCSCTCDTLEFEYSFSIIEDVSHIHANSTWE